MSPQEKAIVRYIAERMSMLYRDSRGRSIYARNIDQVVKDIFGVKHFSKTLEKGMYNESTMVSLMKAMDINTMWAITRSKEHYRMMSVLVAMDVEIVKLGKKLDRILNSEPSIRPSAKFKKLQKTINSYEKEYKRCIKGFRYKFDIKNYNESASLFNFAEDWRDRYDGHSSGYFWEDDGYGGDPFDSVESMDDYVNSLGGSRRKHAASRNGAFDLFGNSYDDDYDEFDEYAGEPRRNGGGGLMANASNADIDQFIGIIGSIIDQRLAHYAPVTQASQHPQYQQRPAYGYPQSSYQQGYDDGSGLTIEDIEDIQDDHGGYEETPVGPGPEGQAEAPTPVNVDGSQVAEHRPTINV